MEVVAWCLAAASIAGVLVYAMISRGRARLEGEVIRLTTSLTRAMEDLQQATATATRQQLALEAAQASGSQAVSDLRVMTARADTLSQQLAELQARVAALTEETHQQVATIERLTASSAALKTERDGLNERLAEQKAWVEEQTRHFEQRVEISTQKLLEERSKAFSEVNRKELDSIVAPFKDQLKEFRERVDHIHSADARDRGQLHQQIQQLTSLNQTVSKAADDLTNALTISTKQTGDWGETILKRILEESGLQEGREYQLQCSIEGAEGEDRRPDAVISLPEGRHLVIDAKVSNKAWTQYCGSTDDDERADFLAAHLLSLRTHMKGLAARDYARSPDLNTVDFVLMFVPVEAALLTALAKDESLYGDAFRNKIVLVVPSTLMAVIKLVEGMWAFQKRKQSADKIAELGGKLYDKLTNFASSFLEIQSAIERTNKAFEKAKGQLADGKGNAITLALGMKKLGVTSGRGKVFPTVLLGPETDDTEDALDEGDGEQIAVDDDADSEVSGEVLTQ